jgi:hypothetical protein
MPWSDCKTMEIQLAFMKQHYQYKLDNRYSLRAAFLMNKTPVFSNRTLVGIDGSISTAIGAIWFKGKTYGL